MSLVRSKAGFSTLRQLFAMGRMSAGCWEYTTEMRILRPSVDAHASWAVVARESNAQHTRCLATRFQFLPPEKLIVSVRHRAHSPVNFSHGIELPQSGYGAIM
jgi:hypothetical protein